MAIFNKYKNTLNNFINSSDPKSLLRFIDKKSCNALGYRGGLTGL